MFAVSKKIFLAFVVLATVLTTGAWQSTPAVVQSQSADSIETPLYSGLTWSSTGVESRDIRVNASGDSFSVSGEKFEAQERFMAGVSLPQDVVDFYSNEQLAASGWESFDVVSGEEGVHYVFSHESGVYLMVDFVTCQDDASRTCVSVWKSEPVTQPDVAPAITSGTETQTATSTFNKKSPSNGATNVSATSLTLSWSAYSPTPDKYTYCINVGSACADNDPDWTSVSGTSVTVSNLGYNKTYYWQVKAVTCVTCTPKTKVDADGGTWWKFTTKSNADVIILGNAGVAGAVLSYVNGTAKTVTADGTGAYSITVPLNWSGTLTPSKTGYRFSPTSATFTNVTAPQIIQNFIATAIYTISGNAGLGGAVLSYTDGTPKTVTADSSGNYSITLPAGWSGTITPSASNPAYSFSPASKTYSNLSGNLTAQNFTATFVTYTISGNVGAPGVTVNFTNIYPGKFVTGANGAYTFTVPKGWSGTVTPTHPCYSFTPASTPYTNVQANQSQSYTPLATNFCVAAILLAGTNPTNASSVNFSVYFTKPATGVDAGDFDLTTAGVAGAAITGVSGSGTTYTVTVSTGTGNGTIRLDLIDDGSVQSSGETLGGDFQTGEIYTILKTPTFADVTVYNQYYPDIEVLYANGLTGGCATTPLLKYCPDTIMDRAQAAVFIMRGEFGSGYNPVPVTFQFQDDWTKGPWARPWAEAMREASLTAGCKVTPSLLYCPWQSLPRAQLVVYALRLKYGNSYMPPAATGTIFADMTDPNFYATPWAEQAYKDELIPACGFSGGKPLFCPNNIATRGLGAYIIVRAKGLITP